MIHHISFHLESDLATWEAYVYKSQFAYAAIWPVGGIKDVLRMRRELDELGIPHEVGHTQAYHLLKRLIANLEGGAV
jgi:hypothetical protein